MRALIIPIVTLCAARTGAEPAITVGGYLETYYQLHAQAPSNHVTNLRGFDNRSETFTLSNVALDVKAAQGPVTTHLVLQLGHTPSTYYAAEPALPGTNSVNATSGELWKYIQAATVSASVPHDFVVEAGLFPSPIGPEVIPAKDNWNWSRSNLFFGLPFYHTGVTVSHALGPSGETHWTGKVHAYNGWNSVTDNNAYPSVAVSAAYARGATSAQLLYFGGIERNPGAPEGKPWRHLFDALVQTPVSARVSVLAHADAGFERTHFGTSAWVGGAAYAKVQLCDRLYAALRGDAFYEKVAGGATAIFWPVTWVAEATATLAYQPVDTASLRLEYRHDHAAGEAYFGGDIALDPVNGTAVPDRDMQDTVTLGLAAWF
jgi:hypothetical protein